MGGAARALEAGGWRHRIARRGFALLGGALANPIDGAVLAFTTAAAATKFAERDPYTLNGLVTDWTVREWSVVVGSLAPTLPDARATFPSYDWQAVDGDAILPAGLEIELPLDGETWKVWKPIKESTELPLYRY